LAVKPISAIAGSTEAGSKAKVQKSLPVAPQKDLPVPPQVLPESIEAKNISLPNDSLAQLKRKSEPIAMKDEFVKVDFGDDKVTDGKSVTNGKVDQAKLEDTQKAKPAAEPAAATVTVAEKPF